MSDITVSLEVAKNLRGAGWEQECEFRWVFDEFAGVSQLSMGYILQPKESSFPKDSTDFQAPTAEEILRELPDGYEHSRTGGEWFIKLANHTCSSEHSLANAATMMWIYLKNTNQLKDG